MDSDLSQKLKWLIIFRILVTTLLLSSTIIFQIDKESSPVSKPLLIIYGFVAGILTISLIYAFILPHIKKGVLFAYIQIGIDTFFVSLIIFLTGGFSSVFSFLYLLVIIYASMLLFRRGSLIMASLCCLQYGIMANFEYYNILRPYGMDGNLINNAYYDPLNILHKVIMIMLACFGVALLSGFLSEQIKKTKKALINMENQVKRVEKMAVIGEMSAGLAHEIKNPLASLTGAIQMLREDMGFNQENDKLMNIIMREAERLNTLLTNFLFFAKPPVGKANSIDLSKILNEIISLFEKNKCIKKIDIIKQLSSDIFIIINQTHFYQIIWNLLLNAYEAIQENNGQIIIELYQIKNKYACIKITDTGCGITKENLCLIFNPFFTTKQNGTGLGLSIVHRILESYDGRLDLESAEGKGTTFTLTFKLSNIAH